MYFVVIDIFHFYFFQSPHNIVNYRIISATYDIGFDTFDAAIFFRINAATGEISLNRPLYNDLVNRPAEYDVSRPRVYCTVNFISLSNHFLAVTFLLCPPAVWV